MVRLFEENQPADVRAHQAKIARAEGIIFVAPVYWMGFPAILKGWLDRVWAVDVVFKLDQRGLVQPMLRHVKRMGVVTTCGAPLWWSLLMGQPGRKTILRGMRANCALLCRTLYVAHYRMDASTQNSRTAFLMKVRMRLQRF